MRQLSAKAGARMPTADEDVEAGRYEMVGHLPNIMQSKARRSLKSHHDEVSYPPHRDLSLTCQEPLRSFQGGRIGPLSQSRPVISADPRRCPGISEGDTHLLLGRASDPPDEVCGVVDPGP